MNTPLPAWCRLRHGRSDIVLIAPHGGRRPAADPTRPRARKVNDLYTADLTAELAVALDATAIINDACDRNELDLNRVSQVRRRASWFLDLLIQAITAVLARHAQAQVLIIHGWNVAQPKCDLGIGGIEDEFGLQPLDDAALSVTPAYWCSRVASFRAACADAGISTPVGERYPAVHRNNLLQLLTPRFGDDADARVRQLAAWAAAGRLGALQLELAIPLRWPGALRQALSTAALAAFGTRPTVSRSFAAPTVHLPPSTGMLGFHFHDPRPGLTLFTSIAPFGAATGGRLLLFLGGQEIALFTGEEPGVRGAVGGLEYQATPRGSALRFNGYASRLADAGMYLDLEAALAASTLATIRLDLRFESRAAIGGLEASCGRFTGTIRIDDQGVAIDTRGFFDPLVALRGPGSHAARTHLAATFDGHRALNLRATDGEPALKGLVLTDGHTASHPLGRLTTTCAGDGYTPRHFHLRLAHTAAPIIAYPLACMPILRPLGDGAYARISFGPARFEWEDRTGWGVYEYARRVRTCQES